MVDASVVIFDESGCGARRKLRRTNQASTVSNPFDESGSDPPASLMVIGFWLHLFTFCSTSFSERVRIIFQVGKRLHSFLALHFSSNTPTRTPHRDCDAGRVNARLRQRRGNCVGDGEDEE